MSSQILDFEFLNAMKNTTIEQQSSKQDITSKSLEFDFDILNDIELEDLESIMKEEFVQGLPSDTESGVM